MRRTVRRPRFTLSNEPGTKTGSVFDTGRRTVLAPLPGFTQLTKGEQFSASPAFAPDFRKPPVRSGAESRNAGWNHPAVIESDKPFTGVGVAAHLIGLEFHYGGQSAPDGNGSQRKF